VRRATHHDTSPGACCPNAIGRALVEMWEEFQEEKPSLQPHATVETTATASPETDKCPECGAPLVFQGGCQICKDCGWSKCN